MGSTVHMAPLLVRRIGGTCYRNRLLKILSEIGVFCAAAMLAIGSSVQT